MALNEKEIKKLRSLFVPLGKRLTKACVMQCAKREIKFDFDFYKDPTGHCLFVLTLKLIAFTFVTDTRY